MNYKRETFYKCVLACYVVFLMSTLKTALALQGLESYLQVFKEWHIDSSQKSL